MFGPGLGLSLATAARDGKRHFSKKWLWVNSVGAAPAWDLILESDPSALDDYTYAFTPFEWPTETKTVTITIASPAVISGTNHPFHINSPVRFTTTDTLPTGFVAGTYYYVISAGFGANSFQLAATQGGAAINTSGSQAGTHTALSGGAGANMMDSHVWTVNFTDGVAAIEIAVHPAYGSEAAAEVYFLLLVNRLGQLPALFRTNLNHILIYIDEGGLANSEDRGHFFSLDDEKIDERLAEDKLEDTFFHEGTHATIQRFSSGKGRAWLLSPEWENARRLDNAAVTQYAQDGDVDGLPELTIYSQALSQEDFAESSLLAWTILRNPERFTSDERAAIQQQIPHRIEFFRRHVFLL